ncbi:enoyl-(Acyl carrier protein) reductase domain-containing protein [Ditylenchus destructor]|nr:enoyl-(Acyl carrier protein) reductase domain-containing protein [Ditylenchus destructor]
MGRFDGKVVIITGASSGIGQDAALEFGKEGASVVIHGQNEERLNKTEGMMLTSGIPKQRILKVSGSLEQPGTASKIIDNCMAVYRKIDVLINNAGTIAKPSTPGDSLDNLDFLYTVNLRSIIELCLLAYPCLKVTKGNIVNVSSAGAVRAFPAAAFYCSLKAALDHFTRNYAQIWGPDGIRINCINPGPIETMILERHGVDNEGLQKHDKWVEETTPLMRSGSPAEMSTILKFLASDEASYVTGASWLADGGHSVSTQKTNFV